MIYRTDGGTTFSEEDGEVTISRDDDPDSIVVPVDDLEQFFEHYFGDDKSGEDDPEDAGF